MGAFLCQGLSGSSTGPAQGGAEVQAPGGSRGECVSPLQALAPETLPQLLPARGESGNFPAPPQFRPRLLLK